MPVKAATKKSATKKSATKKSATKKSATKKSATKKSATKKSATKKSDTTALLERFRKVCLAFPDTTEVEAWGHPTFRVNEKIFASCGVSEEGFAFGVKVTPEMQAALVESDPRFTIAKYVGKHGWVTVDASNQFDSREIESLVRESYGLIAARRAKKSAARRR